MRAEGWPGWMGRMPGSGGVSAGGPPGTAGPGEAPGCPGRVMGGVQGVQGPSLAAGPPGGPGQPAAAAADRDPARQGHGGPQRVQVHAA